MSFRQFLYLMAILCFVNYSVRNFFYKNLNIFREITHFCILLVGCCIWKSCDKGLWWWTSNLYGNFFYFESLLQADILVQKIIGIYVWQSKKSSILNDHFLANNFFCTCAKWTLMKWWHDLKSFVLLKLIIISIKASFFFIWSKNEC